MLRVDISDLVDYGTGRGGDRMYELTVRFWALDNWAFLGVG